MSTNPFPNEILGKNVKFFETRAELNSWIDEVIDILYIVKNDEKYGNKTTLNVKDAQGNYKRINEGYEIKQREVSVTTVPKEITIEMPYDEKCRMPDINVLKRVTDITSKTITLLDFTSGDAKNFIGSEYVVFDGTLKLKTSFAIDGEDVVLEDGYIAKSFKIEKSKFKKIVSLNIT